MIAGMSLSYSQTPDTLLITECYIGGNPGDPYVEITNMGLNPVNLTKYFIMSNTNGGALGVTGGYYKLTGTLQPGGSYLIIGNRKQPDLSTPDLYDSTDYTPAYYRAAPYDLMLPNFGTGASGLPGFDALRTYEGDEAIAIGFDFDSDGLWKPALGDIIVDQVGLLAADGGNRYVYPDVAGVTDATVNNILIRKFSIKLPNAGNFKNGMGVGSEDSDWIVVPFSPSRTSDFFTTVRKHGDSFPYEVSSSSVTIAGNSITVPWGVRRDSLYQEFNFGENIAWFLRWGPDTLESVITQTLDTLYIYQPGNSVTVTKLGVTQSAPAADMNLVYPRYDRNDLNLLFLRYGVSDDFNPDTIFNVPFGTRIDTLYSYLEKSPGASWNIDYIDDTPRPDLKTGDKLVVKAEDNSVKEYHIELNEFIASANAYLGAIYIYGDTLFGFKRNVFTYTEMLSPGSSFPAISATPESLNAKVRIDRPVSIKGGTDLRTATIYVTAQDDSTELIYTVTFELMRSTEVFRADPIFSSVINGIGNLTPGSTATSGWGKGYEIFNPGNTVIPLGDYLIGNFTASSISAVVKSKDMQYRMRPGFTLDSARIGVGIYYNERSYPFITDLEPLKTVLFGRSNNPVPPALDGNAMRDYVDFFDSNGVSAFAYTRYGFVDGFRICFFGENNSLYLLRINNDSIFNGLKSADDPLDYTLVDLFGAQGVNNNRTIEGVVVGSTTAKVLERKKEIWKGNPNNHGSFGTSTPGSGEWDVVQGAYTIGSHPYTPYTGYISTVSSIIYNVSLDYGLGQTIDMVPPGTTVDAFVANLDTNGSDAELTVTNSDSTVVKVGTDVLVQGDRLNVVSGTKINASVYTISIQEPNHDAVLTSSDYTITIDGSKGTVTGIPAFTTIEDLLNKVFLPNGAVLNVVDMKNQLVGTEKVLFDTLLIVKTLVSDSILLEVVAEDGVTIINYSLGITVENPFVTSDFYLVLQDPRIIDMFQANTTVLTFLSRLVPSTGATMTVVDNAGNIRGMEGIMYKDDHLLVSDGTKISSYSIKDMYDAFATDATLSDISVDGVTIAGFDPAVLSYSLILNQFSGIPDLPVVDAEANQENAVVTITQAVNLQGDLAQRTATISVLAEDRQSTSTYSVVFDLNVGITDVKEVKPLIYAEGRTICIKSSSLSQFDEVEVFNLTGQKILQKRLTSNLERIQVKEPTGMFVVKVKWSGKTQIEKIILR